MKSNYYEMTYDDSSAGGCADAPDDILYYQYDQIVEMKAISFSFVLDNNIFEDFVQNNLGFPLVSPRLKVIFDQYKKSAPFYNCLPARIFSKNKKISFEYFLILFKEKPDVLDYQKTRVIDNDYIYGYFAFEKIRDYSFFPQPRDFDGTFVISDELKTEMIKQGVTGAEFTKADVTFKKID